MGVTLNVEEARLVRLAIFGPLLGPLAVKYSLHFGQLSDVPRFWIWVLVVILGIVGAIVGVLWEFRGTVRESGGGQVRTGIAAGSIGLGLILANLSSNAVLLGIGLLGFMCLIAASVNALTHYVLRYVNFSRRVD